MSLSFIKRRSANYSKAELDCLLRYLEDNPELISTKLGGQYKTLNDIRIAWDELAEKIAAVGGMHGFFSSKRSGQEVKRKWADLKSRVKAKAATIAMEADTSEGVQLSLKLTPVEERVLGIISQSYEAVSDSDTNAASLQENKVTAVKVFSFQSDSNMEDVFDDSNDYDENERNASSNVSDAEIIEEVKVSGSDDKKRRLSEAFSTIHADRKAVSLKKLKNATEEEQLQELCKSQIEISAELYAMKDILKKCQVSIEKVAVLKRAELRLKCAKYGVDFGDLFD